MWPAPAVPAGAGHTPTKGDTVLVAIQGSPIELPDPEADLLIRVGVAEEIERAVVQPGTSGRVQKKPAKKTTKTQ